MEHYVSRTIKPLVEGVLVFIAVRYLTGSVASAIGIGLIPLALGWLAIGTSLGAAITVTTVVASLCWYSVPADIKAVVRAQAKEATSESDTSVASIPAPAKSARNESRESEPAAEKRSDGPATRASSDTGRTQ